MLKKICVFILFIPSVSAWGETEDSKKSGHKYTVDNIFSERQTRHNYLKSFFLSSGISLYRESTKKSFTPFSSFVLGFNRTLGGISNFGDISLQASVFSSKMEKQKKVLLEVSPRISIPEIQTVFPVYIGFGAGLGFYPHHIIQKIPSLSASSQFFAGLRLFDLYHNLGFYTELNLRLHYPFSELEIYLEVLGHFGLIFRF